MPGKDGTGPTGTGPMTGRALGLCTDTEETKRGSFVAGDWVLVSAADVVSAGALLQGKLLGKPKTWLQEQKAVLQDRLKTIDKQLEDL